MGRNLPSLQLLFPCHSRLLYPELGLHMEWPAYGCNERKRWIILCPIPSPLLLNFEFGWSHRMACFLIHLVHRRRMWFWPPDVLAHSHRFLQCLLLGCDLGEALRRWNFQRQRHHLCIKSCKYLHYLAMLVGFGLKPWRELQPILQEWSQFCFPDYCWHYNDLHYRYFYCNCINHGCR